MKSARVTGDDPVVSGQSQRISEYASVSAKVAL